MAISHRADSSAVSGGATTGISIALPAATVSGDLMIAKIGWFSTSNSLNTVPSGWTLLSHQTVSGGSDISVYYKFSTGDTGPFVWGWSANAFAAGQITSWIGVDPVTPFDVTSITNTGISTPAVASSLTTVTDGCIISVAVGGQYTSLTGTFTITQRGSLVFVSGSHEAMWNGDTTQATHGATGTFSSTVNSAWVAITLALRPATTGLAIEVIIATKDDDAVLNDQTLFPDWETELYDLDAYDADGSMRFGYLFTQAISGTQAQSPSFLKSVGKIISATQAQIGSIIKSVGKILNVQSFATIVRNGTPTHISFSAANAFTVTYPTGLVDGDLVIVAATANKTSTIFNPGGNWVSVISGTDGANGELSIFAIIWHTGDPTTQAFTISGLSGTVDGIAECFAYSGADPTPTIVSGATQYSGTVGASANQSPTTSADMLVSMTSADLNTITFSAPSMGSLWVQAQGTTDQTIAVVDFLPAFASNTLNTITLALNTSSTGVNAQISIAPKTVHNLTASMVVSLAHLITMVATALVETGSIIKSIGKTLSSSVTSTGTYKRNIGKIISVAQTSSASIIKSIAKALSLTQAQVATMTRVAAHLLAMTATAVTQVGTIIKSVGKTLTSTAQAQVASIIKSVGKILKATQAQVASQIAIKAISVVLSAAITTTASMVRSIGKLFTLTQSLTVSMVKSVGKKLSSNVTLSPVMSALRAVLLTLSASISSTGTIRKGAAKVLSVTQSGAGSITKGVSKSLSGAVSGTAAMIKSVGKALNGAVGSIGTFVRSIGKNLNATQGLIAALIAAGTSTIKKILGLILISNDSILDMDITGIDSFTEMDTILISEVATMEITDIEI